MCMCVYVLVMYVPTYVRMWCVFQLSQLYPLSLSVKSCELLACLTMSNDAYFIPLICPKLKVQKLKGIKIIFAWYILAITFIHRFARTYVHMYLMNIHANNEHNCHACTRYATTSVIVLYIEYIKGSHTI